MLEASRRACISRKIDESWRARGRRRGREGEEEGKGSEESSGE